MKKMMMRLHLEDLQVDSFATVDHSPAIRGTVHANADLDTAGECVVHVPDSNECLVSWDCPSEYYTACTPVTAEPRNCAVEVPHERSPG